MASSISTLRPRTFPEQASEAAFHLSDATTTASSVSTLQPRTFPDQLIDMLDKETLVVGDGVSSTSKSTSVSWRKGGKSFPSS